MSRIKRGKTIDACPNNAVQESSSTCCAKYVNYCMTMEMPCSPELIVIAYNLFDTCEESVSACPFDAI